MLLLFAVVTATAAEPRPTDVGASDLETLAAAIAARGEHRIAFREERHNELLAEPLLAEGYLEYLPDTGELVKVVTHPEPARMTVTEKAIVVERDDGRRRIALRKRPELSALFAGMRGLIEGDAAVIERFFEHELHRDEKGWRLVLLPKSERLERRLERLIIAGVGDRMHSICTRLDDGEWQYMTFPAGNAAGADGR